MISRRSNVVTLIVVVVGVAFVAVCQSTSTPTSSLPDVDSSNILYDDYDDAADLEAAQDLGEAKKDSGKRLTTLAFVKELKNVTKEAGDHLKLKCDVTGSVPATSIQVRRPTRHT